jgi:hypothetical protein
MMEQKKMVEIWFTADPKRSVLMIAKQTAMKATRWDINRWREEVFWSDTDMQADSYLVHPEAKNEKLSRRTKLQWRPPGRSGQDTKRKRAHAILGSALFLVLAPGTVAG